MSGINSSSTVAVPGRRLPVTGQGDAVIVGGGSAGFVAAIAAARSGRRTILVERQGYLGGGITGTYATTPGFFGDSDGNQIIKGIGWEFVERMEQAGMAIVDPGWWQVQLFPEVSKDIVMDMVLEAGVDVRLHTWASELLIENGFINGLVVQTKGGREVIQGKVFVDASGDADLAALAGAPFDQVETDRLWQTSVDLVVANVDAKRVLAWVEANDERVVNMSMPSDLDEPGLHHMVSLIVHERKDNWEDGEIIHIGPVPTIKLMIYPSISRVQGSVNVDATTATGITQAQIEARKRALDHLAYLKRTVPGYEYAVVVGESHLGVRETRRIQGDYFLTLTDLLENRRFSDVVALNCRALDRHIKGDVFKYEMLNGNHDIPLRALLPQGVENLLVAGRCISCDHDSHASLRGAATCLATGHAAGAAAAVAVQSGGCARQADIAAVQDLLRSQGAVLSTES